MISAEDGRGPQGEARQDNADDAENAAGESEGDHVRDDGGRGEQDADLQRGRDQIEGCLSQLAFFFFAGALREDFRLAAGVSWRAPAALAFEALILRTPS